MKVWSIFLILEAQLQPNFNSNINELHGLIALDDIKTKRKKIIEVKIYRANF